MHACEAVASMSKSAALGKSAKAMRPEPAPSEGTHAAEPAPVHPSERAASMKSAKMAAAAKVAAPAKMASASAASPARCKGVCGPQNQATDCKATGSKNNKLPKHFCLQNL